MKLSAAMAIEGVLRNWITGGPIDQGIKLFNGLKAQYNVHLLADDDHTIEDWLDLEEIFGFAQVVYPEKAMLSRPRYTMRFAQLTRLRNEGYAVQFVIEPDPAVSAFLIKNGFNVLTFTLAAYALPEWRPDYVGTPKPWDKLSETVEELTRLRSRDKRMEEHKK